MSKKEKNPDMTPVLENNFILTKAMNKKYAKITYRRYHSKWQIVTFIVALVLFAIGFAFVFLRLLVPFIIFIVLGLYVFFMSWNGYLYQAFISYRQMMDYFGNPVEMHVVFYPKFFRVKGSKSNYDFLYSQITDIVELEDMSILIVSAKGIITHGQIIDKKAFTPEELNKYYELLYNRAQG
ncbi:MAG: YcxB family protein [Lachnospiraceae bacterium]|jgi:hypothetical protein|nr:YcxB family protein [Lachnospiraceae bacterium]MBP5564952.1 YcxB family protein [Lachnospiraceae bacterium]